MKAKISNQEIDRTALALEKLGYEINWYNGVCIANKDDIKVIIEQLDEEE